MSCLVEGRDCQGGRVRTCRQMMDKADGREKSETSKVVVEVSSGIEKRSLIYSKRKEGRESD